MSRVMHTRSTIMLQTCLILLITGCGTSRPTSYFLLERDRPARLSAMPPSTGKALVVGVAAARMPAYLDREQIVTRTSNHEVKVSDFQAWAESLESSVTRAIAVALDHTPGIKGTVQLPTIAEVKLDRVILVEVVRFDGMLGGSVRLTARILVLDTHRAPLGKPVWFDRTETAAGSSYVALVTTMGGLVDQLSQEVAAALTGTKQKQ
jgi:uncharacterized lipoprotein YmbA